MRATSPPKHPTSAIPKTRNYSGSFVSGPRVVIVTVGLAFAGAFAGALTAMCVVAALTLLTTGQLPGGGAIVGVPGAVGGAFGLIIGPLLAWTLMRSVPIGLAILSSSIVARLGAGLGLALARLNPAFGPISILGGPVVGTLGGALVARRRWPRFPSASSEAGRGSAKSR